MENLNRTLRVDSVNTNHFNFPTDISILPTFLLKISISPEKYTVSISYSLDLYHNPILQC